MPWGGAMQFRVDGKITDFINKSTIEQVLAPDAENPRREIIEGIYGSELRERLKMFLGSELTWANIGHFEISNESIRKSMKDYRLESWFAQWVISQEEGGRSESTATMLKSILQALDDAQPAGEANEHLWNIVLARTAQVIESMTSVYDTEISKLTEKEKSQSNES
jgi:hypothetical protein